ncbi:MAG: hypothetical protein KGL63_14810 [Betaproteobacteria bacterium]|nr:hypothetical protein [Betaproteobacteria bacterium]
MSDVNVITVIDLTSGVTLASVNVPAAVTVVQSDALGPQGPQGIQGPPNELAVGTVTTLPAGSAATASIQGIYPNQTLDLGLPQGATGPQGPAGSVIIPVSSNGAPVSSNLSSLAVNGALVTATSDSSGNVSVDVASPTTVPDVDGGNF